MKLFLAAIFSIVGFAGSLAGQATGSTGAPAEQNSSPQAATAAQGNNMQPGQNIRIAPGSVIPVQLMKSIDAKKVKPGDEIDAEVTADLKSSNGEVIVPKNTKITGKITEAQARNKQQKESQLGIEFDHAAIKDGADMPLPMSIQAVISPSYLSGGSSNNNNSSSQSNAQASPASNGGGMAPGGRSPGMNQPQTSNPGAAASDEPANSNPNPNANAHRQISGNTQGVLGIQNVTLSNAASGAQGSVLTSEKNNVKLEGGTLMLLRVNK